MKVSNKSDLYEFSAILVHETEKAILINHGKSEPTWIPKSMCEFEENSDGKTITVTLKQSLAEEKGIV